MLDLPQWIISSMTVKCVLNPMLRPHALIKIPWYSFIGHILVVYFYWDNAYILFRYPISKQVKFQDSSNSEKIIFWNTNPQNNYELRNFII